MQSPDKQGPTPARALHGEVQQRVLDQPGRAEVGQTRLLRAARDRKRYLEPTSRQARYIAFVCKVITCPNLSLKLTDLVAYIIIIVIQKETK